MISFLSKIKGEKSVFATCLHLRKIWGGFEVDLPLLRRKSITSIEVFAMIWVKITFLSLKEEIVCVGKAE